MNAKWHSVNVNGVVVLLGGSADTSTLHAVIKLFVELFAFSKHPSDPFGPFVPFKLEVVVTPFILR